MISRRQAVIALGVGIMVVAGLPRVVETLRTNPKLRPDPDVPGFRRLENGAITPSLPLAGIGANDAGIMPAPLTDLCHALFDAPRDPDRLPIAVFTDVNCPYCRLMEPWLAGLSPDTVALTWHDLPLLGAGSTAAARAIAAAEAQDAGPAMRDRLHRTRFLADTAYVEAIASGLGLDPVRLLSDMDSATTDDRIARTLGLAMRLGLPGTPALVVGDIIAVGALSRSDLAALIRAAHPPECH
ncbi:MAG: DsbA family protein [Rhodobacteraceae bacterium]|nr:DsbA family protein [Paracoccaceae bacterium]